MDKIGNKTVVNLNLAIEHDVILGFVSTTFKTFYLYCNVISLLSLISSWFLYISNLDTVIIQWRETRLEVVGDRCDSSLPLNKKTSREHETRSDATAD